MKCAQIMQDMFLYALRRDFGWNRVVHRIDRYTTWQFLYALRRDFGWNLAAIRKAEEANVSIRLAA